MLFPLVRYRLLFGECVATVNKFGLFTFMSVTILDGVGGV